MKIYLAVWTDTEGDDQYEYLGSKQDACERAIESACQPIGEGQDLDVAVYEYHGVKLDKQSLVEALNGDWLAYDDRFIIWSSLLPNPELAIGSDVVMRGWSLNSVPGSGKILSLNPVRSQATVLCMDGNERQFWQVALEVRSAETNIDARRD